LAASDSGNYHALQRIQFAISINLYRLPAYSFCGSGVFYSLFTLITENAGKKYRSSLSIAYNFSYPVGFLFLAAAAYTWEKWRDLQLALTIPSFLLIIHLM
jgi:hypothetical protein